MNDWSRISQDSKNVNFFLLLMLCFQLRKLPQINPKEEEQDKKIQIHETADNTGVIIGIT